MTDFLSKIVSLHDLAAYRCRFDDRLLAKPHQPVVVTNGCFDIIHAGHVHSLAAARRLGSVLIVGLNSDASVRALKGNTRPINTEQHRAAVLAAFEFVDAVCVFPDARATEFLRIARPDVYAKSADYTLASLHPEERQALDQVGAAIHFTPLLPGLSTTSILARV